MSQSNARQDPHGAEPLIAAAATPASSRRGSVQVPIDDRQTPVLCSTTTRVRGTAGEINVDFAGPIRPTTENHVARVRIDQRVTLNPWAAKRLAIALGQAATRHEQTCGTLEIDERKRRADGARSRSGARIDGP